MPGIAGAAGSGGITSAATFDEWFRSVLGSNLSGGHSITLDRNAGVYEFLTDEFHPIEGVLMGNEGQLHNNFFTYEILAEFTYTGCSGQFVEFRGTDDAWLYIDDDLVLDLGGIEANVEQYIDLDRLGLVDGQTYQFNFFYAQRQPTQSVFRLRTNLLLSSENMYPSITGSWD